MKGLWKYLAPFAPDQSGAAAVLYGLGGIVVIIDAGGCAGNICSFDEPRWFSGEKSAVFSAGLREIDAILGRDDRLIAKLIAAGDVIRAGFAALIGTPVPAVIGTDYQGLGRLAEKKLGLPVVTIDTNGMARYDKGVEKTYLALFKRFADRTETVRKGTVNVLGNIPLELGTPADVDSMAASLVEEGWQDIRLFHTLEDYCHAGQAEMNILLAPSALPAAQWLKKTFGTPYTWRYVDTAPLVRKIEEAVPKKGRILVVHQRAAAAALRCQLAHKGYENVTTATWFDAPQELWQAGDVKLREEDDFLALVQHGNFAAIVGDAYFKRALGFYTGTYIDFPHFAVSGRNCL